MRDIPEELIRRAAEGDMQAFEDLYRKTAGFVFNAVLRVLGRREEAEETTQEIFLTVHRKLPGFAFQSSFTTWLYRVAVNAAINRGKQISRERSHRIDGEFDPDLASGPKETPSWEHAEREALVTRLLAALSPEHRACIVLRSIEGLSYGEIAEALQININTVRSRLKRARETLLALRKEVNEHEL